MHNSKLKNLEFQLAFTETNLRWLLGETPRNETLITKTRQKIEEIKQSISDLKAN